MFPYFYDNKWKLNLYKENGSMIWATAPAKQAQSPQNDIPCAPEISISALWFLETLSSLL